MPRVGKNIYKRKDGRWEGRYIKERVDGRARYASVYAHSYREVRAKLDEVRKDVSEHLYGSSQAGNVEMLYKDWLSEVSSELKESSIIKYEDLFRLYQIATAMARELSLKSNFFSKFHFFKKNGSKFLFFRVSL